MPEKFDPYKKWLAISPDERPANHYRLLAVPLFEDDPDTIENAADQRMAHVRTFQSGQHSALSQKILNEIAAAKVVLLNAEKKAAYDAKLKAKLSQPEPLRKAKPMLKTREAPATPERPAKQQPAPAQIDIGAGDTPVRARADRKSTASRGPLLLGGAIGTLLLVAGIIFAVVGSKEPAVTDAGTNLSDGDTKETPPVPEKIELARSDTSGATPSGGLGSSQAVQKEDRVPLEPEKKEPADPPVIGQGGEAESSTAVSQSTRPQPLPSESGPPEQVPDDVGQTVVYLDDLQEKESKVGYGRLQKHGVSQDNNQKVHFREKPVAHSLSMVPPEGGPSFATYEIGGRYRLFQATALMFRPAHSAVTFTVLGDGKILWESQPLQKQDTFETCRVDIEGVRLLRVQVDASGSNRHAWAVWVNPLLIPRGDAEPLAQKSIDSAPGTPEDTADTSPAEPGKQPGKRSPVPPQAVQEELLARLKESYGDRLEAAQSPQQKAEFAAELLERAPKLQDDAAPHYVLLQESRRLAIEGGYIPTALAAVESLSARFETDALSLKLETLAALSEKARLPEQQASHAELALRLIGDAIEADRYEEAEQFARIALDAVRGAGGTGINRRSLIQRIADHREEIRILARLYEDAKGALALLDEDPANPKASLTAGRFLCFDKGQWERGLPLLAQSSNEVLQELAAADLAQPTESSARADLAERWWDVAQRERGNAKRALEVRAARWYLQALPGASGPLKTRIEQRLSYLERQGILDSDGSLRRTVNILASGCNHLDIYLNGEPLMKCQRDTATRTQTVLKIGDVLAVKVASRIDVMSLWMMFLTEDGQYLFETSDRWVGYRPAQTDQWWKTDQERLPRTPAQYVEDRRQYVDLVRASAKKAAPPQFQPSQPISSFLPGERPQGDGYLYYVITARDLLPKDPQKR